MNYLRKLKNESYLLRDLLRKEKSEKFKENGLEKYTLLKNGFLSNRAKMYNMNKCEYKFYLSDLQQTKTGQINKGYENILDNKIIFEQLFQNYIDVPRTISTIVKGKFISYDNQINNMEELLGYLHKNKAVIIKPITSSKGEGVYKLSFTDNNFFLNGKIIENSQLFDFVYKLDGNFISEYVQQSTFLNELYSESLNTIRILTMIDPDTNYPFIAGAMQRIGTSQSAPTDNFSKGGLSAGVNIETGELSKAAANPTSSTIKWYSKHPENNNQIEGRYIPNWNLIKEKILEVSFKTNYLKYVGWDVVLTEDSIMLLEGNSWSDVRSIQIHEPLLKNPNVLEFYKHHNIL